MNVSNFSKRKKELLDACYRAILHADDKKIDAAFDKYYENDDWLEEDITPIHIPIGVIVTGISTELILGAEENKINCLSDNFEP